MFDFPQTLKSGSRNLFFMLTSTDFQPIGSKNLITFSEEKIMATTQSRDNKSDKKSSMSADNKKPTKGSPSSGSSKNASPSKSASSSKSGGSKSSGRNS